MGGQGSGGARVGAGRKRKALKDKVLHGTATRAERAQAAQEPAPIIPVPAPRNLPARERAVWDQLAPHALAEKTLTAETADAFRELCEAIVLRRRIAETIEVDGLTIETPLGLKAHPLMTHLRGLMQRVNAVRLQFRLAPFGKAFTAAPDASQDDGFEDFDDDAGAAPVN